MAERYIEIFEEKRDGGKSELSYYGYDRKMHDVGESAKEAVKNIWKGIKATSMNGSVPTPSWIDAATITYILTSCTSDGPERVEKGDAFEAILTLSNTAKTFATCTVTMGGTSITDTAVKAVKEGNSTIAYKKKIEIPEVTGNVVITATQSS